MKAGGRPTDVLGKLINMAGFSENDDVQLYEVCRAWQMLFDLDLSFDVVPSCSQPICNSLRPLQHEYA